MKKLMTVLPALMISLSAALCTYSPTAQAGIILANDSDPQIRRIGSITTTVGFVVLIVSAVTLNGGGLISGLTLVVLDADGNLPQNEISEMIATRFPFIDNAQVTNDLSNKIAEKYKNESNSLVTLTVEETLSILAPAGLSEAEENLVVNTLK